MGGPVLDVAWHDDGSKVSLDTSLFLPDLMVKWVMIYWMSQFSYCVHKLYMPSVSLFRNLGGPRGFIICQQKSVFIIVHRTRI